MRKFHLFALWPQNPALAPTIRTLPLRSGVVNLRVAVQLVSLDDICKLWAFILSWGIAFTKFLPSVQIAIVLSWIATHSLPILRTLYDDQPFVVITHLFFFSSLRIYATTLLLFGLLSNLEGNFVSAMWTNIYGIAFLYSGWDLNDVAFNVTWPTHTLTSETSL